MASAFIEKVSLEMNPENLMAILLELCYLCTCVSLSESHYDLLEIFSLNAYKSTHSLISHLLSFFSKKILYSLIPSCYVPFLFFSPFLSFFVDKKKRRNKRVFYKENKKI